MTKHEDLARSIVTDVFGPSESNWPNGLCNAIADALVEIRHDGEQARLEWAAKYLEEQAEKYRERSARTREDASYSNFGAMQALRACAAAIRSTVAVQPPSR